MTWLLAAALSEPPLDPSPDDASSLLRRELVRPEYHEHDVLQQILDWVGRMVDGAVDAASGTPPLSTFAAMVAFLLLALGLGWLLSRARRTARAARDRAVLPADRTVTAADLRARAERALAEGRSEDAVVDAFRALAVRQVERGRIEDRPGATAHEVAAALGAAHPHQQPDVDRTAALFDAVRYGDRPATTAQAQGVLELDDALAGRP
ncbi:DUF4129 domain-containing protein [Nocardioides sp. T2.26MG-1]|uniref:DUF4129 domain-containing protein n=1 Tax=Nocardioides sp. T2.26MG-1 TaxID=3041166 RepID=UPI0024778D45|nr:DUF4129 domain-containing protein [Nocardioides sp. T2.26MG-1]CAI9416745.1 hypothetical protein HIDPHFAB_02850 [Nocardioides sp. T2.26MG-1]